MLGLVTCQPHRPRCAIAAAVPALRPVRASAPAIMLAPKGTGWSRAASATRLSAHIKRLRLLLDRYRVEVGFHQIDPGDHCPVVKLGIICMRGCVSCNLNALYIHVRRKPPKRMNSVDFPERCLRLINLTQNAPSRRRS